MSLITLSDHLILGIETTNNLRDGINITNQQLSQINEKNLQHLKMRAIFTEKLELIYLLKRTFTREFYIAESILAHKVSWISTVSSALRSNFATPILYRNVKRSICKKYNSCNEGIRKYLFLIFSCISGFMSLMSLSSLS